jgi:hypothetical protein
LGVGRRLCRLDLATHKNLFRQNLAVHKRMFYLLLSPPPRMFYLNVAVDKNMHRKTLNLYPISLGTKNNIMHLIHRLNRDKRLDHSKIRHFRVAQKEMET